MRTRIIALIVAVILAIAGGALLYGYVSSADQRAADGAELTDVLVVATEIPAGTPVSQLALLVEPAEIPAAFRADGAITSLDELEQLDALVTTAVLVPGEQLVAARLASAEAFVGSGGSVVVPEGLQAISVAVDAQRIVGGRLVPGDLVGLYVSTDATGEQPRQTRLLIERLLVTAVDGGAATTPTGTVVGAGGTVTVTVAVTQAQAATIIHAQEFARIWFSKQTETTAQDDGVVVTDQGLGG